MGKHLFTVEDVWRIWRKGLILAPGVSADDAMTIPQGSEIELRRPDGTMHCTAICAIEYPPSVRWLCNPDNPRYGIIVSEDVRESDVPIGTEVYLR